MIDPEVLKEEYEVFAGGIRYNIEQLDPAPSYDDRWLVQYRRNRHDYLESAYVFKKTLVADNNYEQPLRLRKKARQEPKTVFHIRAGREGWEKDEWVKLETIDDLETAKATVANHAHWVKETDSPWRFMMKSEQVMSDVFDYDQWAEFRFEIGDWDKLPWADQDWADRPETQHHFAHFAKERDPGVAYWATPQDAQADRISSKTIGAYLREFYGDILSPSEIEDWVTRSDPPGDLKISGFGPDDIYEAYRDSRESSHSCMIYADEANCHDGINWRSGKNPVRVFGAGDLAVATLWRRGKCAARALVWPEKKVAGRRYGDYKRLELALKQAGYQIDGNGNDMHTEGGGLFEGARLLREAPENYPQNLIAPYLDLHYRVRLHDDHLTLTRDRIDNTDVFAASRTDGLLLDPNASLSQPTAEDEFVCPRCEETTPDDDARTVQVGRGQWEDWCDYCRDEHTYGCDNCGESSTESYVTHTEDEFTYCNTCADHQSVICDCCLDQYSASSTQPVYDAENPEAPPENWCPSCREDDTILFRDRLTNLNTLGDCQECGEWIPDNESVCNSCETESEAA